MRSTSNTDKIAHLEQLAAALPGTLDLYEADLLKEGSFDEVIKDADYVFHTASPFLRSCEDPQVLSTRMAMLSAIVTPAPQQASVHVKQELASMHNKL